MLAILGREKVFAELKELEIELPEIILPLILYRHLRGKYNTFSGIAGKEDISLQDIKCCVRSFFLQSRSKILDLDQIALVGREDRNNYRGKRGRNPQPEFEPCSYCHMMHPGECKADPKSKFFDPVMAGLKFKRYPKWLQNKMVKDGFKIDSERANPTASSDSEDESPSAFATMFQRIGDGKKARK
jgi:hypothetical protein